MWWWTESLRRVKTEEQIKSNVCQNPQSLTIADVGSTPGRVKANCKKTRPSLVVGNIINTVGDSEKNVIGCCQWNCKPLVVHVTGARRQRRRWRSLTNGQAWWMDRAARASWLVAKWFQLTVDWTGQLQRLTHILTHSLTTVSSVTS